MERLFVGIDPGKKGAAALIDMHGHGLELLDLPFDGKRFDICEFVKCLISWHSLGPLRGCLESQFVKGSDSRISDMTIGINYGLLYGALKVAHVPFFEVHPMTWKARYGLVKKEKIDSVNKALSLFPKAELKRSKKRGQGEVLLDGRAEALLLANYSMHKWLG